MRKIINETTRSLLMKYMQGSTVLCEKILQRLVNKSQPFANVLQTFMSAMHIFVDLLTSMH